MSPTLGRPGRPGESERSDLSGVEAKRPPLVSKYPEMSDLFLSACCSLLVFVKELNVLL